MGPRLKKAATIAVKAAVLGGVLYYAGQKSQLADEIAAPSAETPAAAALAARGLAAGSGAELRFVLPTPEGDGPAVRAGERLRVVAEVASVPGGPRAYRIATAGGQEAELAASEVEGAGEEGSSARPFTLLPGARTLFARLDGALLAAAFFLFGPPLFLMVVRWRMLLSASGIHVPLFTLARLHYLGFFFNTFMPGGAGGDVIKAVYLTRHCDQKAEAATVVLIDRAVGLVGLLLMAGGVVLADYRELGGLALQVGAVWLAGLVGGTLYFSARFRALVRYEALLEKLPKAAVVKRVDAALYGLRHRKAALAAALALTVFLQLLEVVGVWYAGRSIGLYRARFAHYLAFVPIGYLVNALPLSFGGIGLMEGAYLKLFHGAGVATATEGFMLGVLARLIVVGWSLVGALSAIFPPAGIAASAVPAGEAAGTGGAA